jgi:hypothetical protein
MTFIPFVKLTSEKVRTQTTTLDERVCGSETLTVGSVAAQS